MTVDEGVPPGDGNGDDVARLVALTERQHELWALLRDAQQENARNDLFDELTANREELASLKKTVTAQVDEPISPAPTEDGAPPEPDVRRSVGEELRAAILTPPEEIASAAPPPPPPSPSQSSAESPPPEQSPPPEPTPAPDTDAPPDRDVAGETAPPSKLSPESTPFSTREADLAATQARRAGAARAVRPSRPDPEPPPTPTPAPQPEAEPESLRPAQMALRDLDRVRPKHIRSFPVLAVVIAVAAVAAVAWFLFFRGSDSTESAGATTTTAPAVVDDSSEIGQIRAVLDGLGLSSVAVEERSGTVFLTGVVATDAERDAAIGATAALAGEMPVDATSLTVGVTDDDIRGSTLQAIADAGYDRINVSVEAGVATLTGVTPEGGSAGLVAAVSAVPGINQVVDLTETSDRATALDSELKRITAVTPIVFASGQTDLNALQERILDSVAEIIQAYDGPLISVVGYTDSAGAADENERLSLLRAENVRDYLIAQGITAGRLTVEARGEVSATGSEAVAGLERRVEFEVGYTVDGSAAGDAFRIGIVAPSARDDFAFTQSIVDAVAVISAERGGVEVDISDGLFVTEDAAAAIRSYAEGGYDLVIAHGSQYGTSLAEIAPEFPTTAFAWGTAADTFGQPNISSYEVQSDEGGYVMGVVSALLSNSDVVGVVGPLEVGDAQLFVNGFSAGVLATNSAAEVPVIYTGSFSDVALAAEAAQLHVDAGADILTGTAQMVVGAVGVASENDALWFGTQANQTDLAPDLVVASQVYHWEVVLRQIISGIEQGSPGGEAYSIDLANGGIIIEYNADFDLATAIRDTADDTIAGIISGTISTGS